VTSTGGNGLHFAYSSSTFGSGSYDGTFNGNIATVANGAITLQIVGNHMTGAEPGSKQSVDLFKQP